MVVAGAAAGLAIAFLLGRVGQGGNKLAAPNPPPVVAAAPPPAVVPPAIPTTTAPPAAVEAKPADEADTAEAKVDKVDKSDKADKSDKSEKDEKDLAAKVDGEPETAGKAKPARVSPAAGGARARRCSRTASGCCGPSASPRHARSSRS